MKKFLLLVVALMTAYNVAIAQPSVPPASHPSSSALPASSQPNQLQGMDGAARLEVLQAQLQTMKEYHASLLDTVYWAMGGVFLIAGILVGFGWFANFKIYERDKTSLKADLDAHLRERIIELEKLVEGNASAAEATLVAKLETLIADHVTKLTKKIAQAESTSQSKSEALDRAITALKITVLDNAMRQKDNPTVAITDAVPLLELCAAKAPNHLDRILAFFLDQLEKGGKLLVAEISRVTAVLTKLPPEHKAYVDRIGPKLVDSKML